MRVAVPRSGRSLAVGTDIKLAKQHALDVYYRFQDQRHVDESDYDPDMHYLGVSYKFKF